MRFTEKDLKRRATGSDEREWSAFFNNLRQVKATMRGNAINGWIG